MKIEVLLFAQLKEAFGADSRTLEVEEGRTARDAVALLFERDAVGDVKSLPISFAVNEEIVDPDHVLRDGDRLALLTPVSGG